MSEIKLHIEDRYLQAFLDFLKTVSYISVREVSGEGRKANGAVKMPLQDEKRPIVPFAESLEEETNLAKILHEQGYKGPDKDRFQQLAAELDIQETAEELISQLTK